MGNPKQKWTPEEEAALRAGVDKHGAGKWRTIQKDPEFAIVLSTRSNVDLKDKWRNMNVGICGHASREKLPKAFPKLLLLTGGESVGVPSGEFSSEEAPGVADALVSSDSSKDRKVLDPRYTELIINAINDINDANGSSTTIIAAYIETHHPVPTNFRRLLSSKLRDMVNQGNLVKVKQNYKVNNGELTLKTAGTIQGGDDRKEIHKGLMKGSEMGIPLSRGLQDSNMLDPSKRTMRGGFGAVDFAKLKSKTVQEAARAAALAVAEAEAAAAAAEKAAKEAEAAEAEAEAAEIAAELAALAARPSKKVCGVSLRMEDRGITV